jgi:allophanate hydrolase
MNISDLQVSYRQGTLSPREVVAASALRMAEGDAAIWISRLDEKALAARVDALRSPESQPLFGVPFAIKDNIDLAGLPTTAACPDFAYAPAENAFVVQRLIDAGAVPMGKTNLDQFATGLVGTRTPYGVCRNAFDPAYIPGGSSAGSALAVASGQVAFALGTDTAGSGRVPAAFNNLVGLKPTRGLFSNRGVVPACRSLDCVSVFARTVADARAVFQVLAAPDAADPWSRRQAARRDPAGPVRFGVPRPDQLTFFGNGGYERLFAGRVRDLQALGWQKTEIDFAPFLETARLLYEGPWVAERTAAIRNFLAENPESLLPITRHIIAGGLKASAVDAFEASYRLQALRRQVDVAWEAMDLLLTPTTGTHYTLAEVEADPLGTNANLGAYTNFMNLLDLCAVAVPAGFTPAGLPFGVTLAAPAFRDAWLLDQAEEIVECGMRNAEYGVSAHSLRTPKVGRDRPHTEGVGPDGGGQTPYTSGRDRPHTEGVGPEGGGQTPYRSDVEGQTPYKCDLIIQFAVCGAHLLGLPLNHQITDRGGRFVRATRSAPCYRMIALPGPIPKPGMLRQSSGGVAIDVEVWEMPLEHFGSFVAGIPPPLGIGTVLLEDGGQVKGFICEGVAAEEGATDISHFGAWREYLKSIGK